MATPRMAILCVDILCVTHSKLYKMWMFHAMRKRGPCKQHDRDICRFLVVLCVATQVKNGIIGTIYNLHTFSSAHTFLVLTAILAVYHGDYFHLQLLSRFDFLKGAEF